MPKFYRNVKTGQVISEDQYRERLLENSKASSWDMANAGMGLADDLSVNQNVDEYEEYVPEEEREE